MISKETLVKIKLEADDSNTQGEYVRGVLDIIALLSKIDPLTSEYLDAVEYVLRSIRRIEGNRPGDPLNPNYPHY